MTRDSSTPMEVGIIGGGIMGLATAFYLAQNGVRVTVLEKEKEVGGLSKSEEIMPGFRWDRFYHVILSTDQDLLDFISDIGLDSDVKFTETRTGFYANGQLHSMSNTQEFLKFEPLSLWNKLRLGAGVFYASQISNWERLEKIDVKTWLIRVFGRRNYEKMWDPLLRSKLGTAKDQASAAFIWAIIKRLYGTRKTSSKKELMGCTLGGYYSIVNHIRDRLSENGTRISVDHAVERIEPLPDARLLVRCSNGKAQVYDRVVATIPNPGILRICPDLPDDLRSRLKAVRYLSLICVTLVLKRSLTPFYITNLIDPGFPFTGLIEATHIVPRDILGTKALIYLPRWLPSNDPFQNRSDQDVLDTFLTALRRISPRLSNTDIVAQTIHREHYVQPILEPMHSKNIPPMKTAVDNFYIVNTTMILNSTLNNNQVIQLARKMVKLLLN